MKNNFFKKNSVIKKYQSLINQINSLEETIQVLSDDELRAYNAKLSRRYQDSNDLDSVIIESFALTREASLRTLGLRHFDVQLIGGLVLNNQRIAEMKTGEGKTLVATLPASLNALTGKGVQIVTVNDYLANRDQVSMGQVYRFLGLTTGLIQSDMLSAERKRNYQADITYVTNYELTFDYLRDNRALNLKEVVLRPFHYCIIDEVDSILIDEAQTPLILADNLETSVDKYVIASEIVDYLESNIHYTIDEKNKNVILTDEGSKQVEQILKIQNLYDPRDPWIPYIMNAIRANALFLNNTQYIVQNERVIIVDEFTGRIMPDRRWGDGLHQAIEAKEKLPIRQINETIAAMTYQNFFLLYPKLSGMTGTGKTSEIEFEKIYNLSVDEIPTAKKPLRNDLPDLVYKDQFSKWNAVAKTCNDISSTGQPLLIGTTTVEKSEMLAELLNEYNLSYELLNAKPENARRESEIVSQAGKRYAITIATNMAGRGTDIILGGNISFKIQKELYTILTLARNYQVSKKTEIFKSLLQASLKYNSQKFLSVLFSLLNDLQFLELSDVNILKTLRDNNKVSMPACSYQCSIKFLISELNTYYKKNQKQENQIVKNLGGLYIIGTERNDSRRVDNQLRGRCGRQGDPGTSQFFLSLDDNLLRLFGGPGIQTLMKSKMMDDTPLESKILTRSLNSAQRQIEERAYQQRKNLFEYDEILNTQRDIVYFERRQILEGNLSELDIPPSVLAFGEQLIADLVVELKTEADSNQEILSSLERFCGKSLFSKNLKPFEDDANFDELKLYLFHEFWLLYEAKLNELAVYAENIGSSLELSIILTDCDRLWREHLQKMALLREAVGWRGYGQQNPLYEYKREAFALFNIQQRKLKNLVMYELLRSVIL
jgi:preprotein translocase subunit SecA